MSTEIKNQNSKLPICLENSIIVSDVLLQRNNQMRIKFKLGDRSTKPIALMYNNFPCKFEQ